MSWSSGDWLCGACQHGNFKKRETCQKCNFPKHGTQADISSYMTYNNVNKAEVLAGDWYCHCGGHNYASRTSCFRCGNIKAGYGGLGYDAMMMGAGGGGHNSEQLAPGWKAGDWLCTRPGCGLHNYACRMECYKCRTPRDCGGAL